jgi:hypothetical protein
VENEPAISDLEHLKALWEVQSKHAQEVETDRNQDMRVSVLEQAQGQLDTDAHGR